MAEEYNYQSKTEEEKRNHIVEINEKITKSRIEHDSPPILPEIFIKYYSCNQNSLNVLKERRIWATNPCDFNDPYDCSPMLWEGANFPYEEIKNWLKNVFSYELVNSRKNANQLRELFFNTVRDLLVFIASTKMKIATYFGLIMPIITMDFKFHFIQKISLNP